MGIIVLAVGLLIYVWYQSGSFWIGLAVSVGLFAAMMFAVAKDEEMKQREIKRKEDDAERLVKPYREKLAANLAAEINRLNKAAEIIVENHFEALRRRYRAGITKDDFGVEDTSEWGKAEEYFIKNVLLPSLDLRELVSLRRKLDLPEVPVFDLHLFDVEIYLKALISEQTSDDEHIDTSGAKSSGEIFEHRCADILEKNGWATEMTPKIGDQGVDILAKKDGMTVALQCKNYQAPVGNSAIQEISAGRAHYNADYAVVVSPSGYTKSARMLAESNGVLIIDVSELGCLADKITSHSGR